MIEGSVKTEKPKESHLDLSIPGNRPIFACTGTKEDFKEIRKWLLFKRKVSTIPDIFEERLGNVDDVKYGSGRVYRHLRGFLSNESGTYVISSIDEDNKFSRFYKDCTGLIAAGVEIATGNNVSFLTHQDPKDFLKPHMKSKITKDLNQRFEELKARCIPETIDILIIGGNYINQDTHPSAMPRFPYEENYINSIKFISGLVQQTLGFQPVMVNGPKVNIGFDNIYFDTQNRRLYFLRPEVNENGRDFTASDFETNPEPWVFKPQKQL